MVPGDDGDLLAPQLDGPPDADGRDAGTEVPAPGEGGLATKRGQREALGEEPLTSLAAVALRDLAEHARQPPERLGDAGRHLETREWWREPHQHLVRTSQHLGDVELRRAEHVLVCPEAYAAQPHLGDRVQTMEDEAYALVSGKVGRAREATAEPPVTLLDPPDGRLVVVAVRVVDPAGGNQ